MRTNPIIGFGIKINWNDVDILKYVKAAGKGQKFCEVTKCKVEKSFYKNVDEIFDDFDCSMGEDFEVIIKNSDIPKYLKHSIAYACSNEDEDLLLYYPCYPWQLTDEERQLSNDTKVRKAITTILTKIYKDEVDMAEVEKDIGEIYPTVLYRKH
jgi:hypothetical protein